MTWKRRSTSQDICVEVDLTEFSDEQLLQALIDSGRITEATANALMSQKPHGEQEPPDDLYRARLALTRGDRKDALHYIENYLGRDWYGTLQ